MTVSRGVLGIAAVFAAFAALYWPHAAATAMPLDARVSYFAGACAAICMALGLLLSARPRAVETAFGGLDRMYKVHKYLGVASLLLFMAHFATVPGGGSEDDAVAATAPVAEAVANAPAATAASTAAPAEALPGEDGGGGLPVSELGLIAMAGFTLLIVVTLNRKIPYHRWISTHRLMGLFYAVVAIHVAMALYEGEGFAFLSAPGAFIALALLAGLAAFTWKQVVHPGKERHRFSLAEVNRLERATEVVLQPRNGMIPFEPGQFAFVTIDAEGFREAHPFTISSGAGEGRLRFTMKVLGDYTRRVRDGLSVGADAAVEGPYGRFAPLRDPSKQVWVAGGIGITPFLSALRTMEPGHGRTVRLYYCVRTAREALFLDELKARSDEVGGVSVTVLESDAGQRIDADGITDGLGGSPGDWSFWLCGPKPMVAALSTGLSAKGVARRQVHNEEFEFR